MIVIVLGIITLVYCSKYKKQPLLPTLSTLKTVTVILAVFFCFNAISLISSVITLASGALFETFEEIFLAFFRAAEVDTIYIAGILGNISNFIHIAMWTSLIMDIAVIVFGIIALVNGIKTFSDRTLESTAATNTAEENQRRQAMFAQNMRNYQQNAYNQQGYGYNPGYNQQYGYNQQNMAYQQNMAQNPQQNSFSTQTTANAGQTGWVCASCGSNNIAVANFCSHCGAKH